MDKKRQNLALKKLSDCLLVFVFMPMILVSCVATTSEDESEYSSDSSVINVQHRLEVKKSTSSDNYTRLGAGYLAKNNYEKAMIKLQKAISLNSQNATAYNYMGVLYWRLEQSELADLNFKRSLKISPYNAAIIHNYASYLCSSKRYKEAQKMYAKVFSNPLYNRLSYAYQESADCDMAIKEFIKAEKKYKKSLKLDKNNSSAMLGIAKLYYKKDNLKVAVYYFDRFEKLSRHSPDSLWFGINLQRQIGDKNKLSSYILELKNLYPDTEETLLWIEGKTSY